MAHAAYRDLAGLAATIAERLTAQPDPEVEGNPLVVARIIEETIAANFRAEQAISQEAEKLLAELGAQTGGMDRGKLLAGLRQRLAKQKGFVL